MTETEIPPNHHDASELRAAGIFDSCGSDG